MEEYDQNFDLKIMGFLILKLLDKMLRLPGELHVHHFFEPAVNKFEGYDTSLLF